MHDEYIGQPPQCHRLRRTNMLLTVGAVPSVIVIEMFGAYKIFEACVECLASAGVVVMLIGGKYFCVGGMVGGLDEYHWSRGGGAVWMMIGGMMMMLILMLIIGSSPFDLEEQEGFSTVGSED